MDTSETLWNLLEEAGFEPRSYSGRGMYGRECIGVTVSDWQELVQSTVEFILTDKEYKDLAMLENLFGEARTDSMGYNIIVYWPRIEVPNTEQEIEEDNER